MRRRQSPPEGHQTTATVQRRPRTLMAKLRSRSGQTTTEYILMLAIAVMIAMKFKAQIGTVVERATGKMSEKITSQIDGME